MDREPHVLAHVVRDVVSMFRQRHPTRVVHLGESDRNLIVEAGASQLQLLIGNLLGNAHKYSPAGEPIEVEVRRRDQEAEVVVRDRGIGFDLDEAGELFRPFFRTTTAKATAGGVGIGLAACAQLVAMLDGRMWALPRPGGGSEFGFGLPAGDPLVD